VRVQGGTTINDIDVGDAATAYKYLVSIKDVLWGHANAELLNDNTGHGLRIVEGNHGISTTMLERDGAVRVKSERAQMAGGGVTVAGGATGIAIADSRAGDLAGVIRIDNGTGSASSTGLIAVVTMHQAPVLEGTPHYFAVQLTPLESSALGVPTNAAANFYGCKLYASATSNDLTKFSVGIKTALPAGEGLSFAYRVTVL
jgi:hypothetical protein